MQAINMQSALCHAQIIRDDAEARAFLLAENAFSGLVPTPPYNTCSAFWYSANTHAHIYALNSRVPGDEGYVIVIFPEAFYTHEQAALLMSLMSAHNNKAPGTERCYEQDLANPQN